MISQDQRSGRGTVARVALWTGVVVAGTAAWAVLALSRGEHISAAWLLAAALCTYAVAHRFYARWIARRVLRTDDERRTPAERLDDGVDFVPTDRRVLFGHHFAAIAGAGPLVGPVLAAQMGYLPGTLWIVVGAVFAGAARTWSRSFCPCAGTAAASGRWRGTRSVRSAARRRSSPSSSS